LSLLQGLFLSKVQQNVKTIFLFYFKILAFSGPRLSPFYHPDTPETYLEQRFNMHGRLGRGDFGEVNFLYLYFD